MDTNVLDAIYKDGGPCYEIAILNMNICDLVSYQQFVVLICLILIFIILFEKHITQLTPTGYFFKAAVLITP